MKPYLYETHLHTSPVSRCGRGDVEENLLYYKEQGYDGVFITNHFIDGNMHREPDMTYEEIYENIKMKDIMNTPGIDEEKNIFDISNLIALISNLNKQKGLDNSTFRETIEKNLNINEIYESEIDFGLLAYSVNNKAPLELFKEDIPKENNDTAIVALAVEEKVPVQQSGTQNTKEETVKEEVPVNDLRAKMMRMTNR